MAPAFETSRRCETHAGVVTRVTILVNASELLQTTGFLKAECPIAV